MLSVMPVLLSGGQETRTVTRQMFAPRLVVVVTTVKAMSPDWFAP